MVDFKIISKIWFVSGYPLDTGTISSTTFPWNVKRKECAGVFPFSALAASEDKPLQWRRLDLPGCSLTRMRL